MAETYTPSQEEVVALLRETERRLQERISHACKQPASLDMLYALAHSPVLAMSDAGALLQDGRTPSPYRQNNVPEVLEEFEPEIEFFMRCVEAGELIFPCLPIEFVLWAESHRLELPDFFVKEVVSDTQDAGSGAGGVSAHKTLREMLRNQPRRLEKPRANGKDRRVALVKAGLEEIECRAKTADIQISRSNLPGNSKPYIGIIRRLSPDLAGRPDDLIKEDLAALGCRWSKGSRALAAEHILNLFSELNAK